MDPAAISIRKEANNDSKPAADDDMHSLSIGEDNDCKPVAVDDDMPTTLDRNEAPSIASSKSMKLHEWRVAYADSFLSRCNKVDPNDFDLPFGTYVCPWMPIDPVKEEYYELEIVECRACGQQFDKPSEEQRDHPWSCEVIEDLDEQYKEMSEKIKRAIADYEEQSSVLFWSTSKQEELQKRDEILRKREGILRRIYELRTDPWKPVPKESNNEPDNSEKYLKYWASRCETEDMPLFGAEVRRRPDIQCPSAMKKLHGNKNLDFGSHAFQASLVPSSSDIFTGFSPCAIQTTWIPLDDSLNPCIWEDDDQQCKMGLCYTKEAVWAYNQRPGWDEYDEYEEKEVFLPFIPHFSIPPGGVNPSITSHKKQITTTQHGGSNADVWTTENREIRGQVNDLLGDFAAQTNDCPLPRYQMIIDPNQFVRSRNSDGEKVWVPCEFDVSPDGCEASLVGDDRAHWVNPTLIDSVATPVLNAALPLLAKLSKPYLLLEGQRLQVVVKAQSITVPKKQSDEDPPEYIGLWHVDGEHEPVAAVVLYYYDVDDSLLGGNMEFLDRRPLAVLGKGDTNMPGDMPPGSLREALRPTSDSGDGDPQPLIPNCSVPIKTGTMLVFSNYQMAHRVLRMINTSEDHPASRKFVALFVMDPAAERLVPARSFLAHSYLYKRALTGKCGAFPKDAHQDSIPEPVAELVLEYLGILPSVFERRRTRNEMLRSQLKPKQMLGASTSMVCSTGNGCLTMLGWIDALLQDHTRQPRMNGSIFGTGSDFEKPEKRVNALNYPPTEVGRGLSETLSIPSDDLDIAPFFDTMDERNEQLNADFDKMLEYTP